MSRYDENTDDDERVERRGVTIACFCGALFTAADTTREIVCPACRRRAHPPEILITGRLRWELAEILDRIFASEDSDAPRGAEE